MVQIKNYDLNKRQEMIVDKYGAERIEDAINDAQTDFWITIHNAFLMTDHDESSVDIDDEIFYAVLDYIFDNDVELQDKWDATFN